MVTVRGKQGVLWRFTEEAIEEKVGMGVVAGDYIGGVKKTMPSVLKVSRLPVHLSGRGKTCDQN
jgi:hypothetical protein